MSRVFLVRISTYMQVLANAEQRAVKGIMAWALILTVAVNRPSDLTSGSLPSLVTKPEHSRAWGFYA